jgi:hypothetical protein
MPIGQQEMLINILQRWYVDQRRAEIALAAQASLADFREANPSFNRWMPSSKNCANRCMTILKSCKLSRKKSGYVAPMMTFSRSSQRMIKLIIKQSSIVLLIVFSIGVSASFAHAEIPPWLLKKLQNIQPQPASMNPIIIPGWRKQQAQVLAQTYITGEVYSVMGVPAEQAMYEVGEYQGNKQPLIVARGQMKGSIPLGPKDYTDPKVTMVFDQNGNLLKREFEF